MKPGSRPRPTVLHRLRGTFNATRHRDRADPVAPGELHRPPVWLSKVQARRFRQLLEQAPRRLLRQADGGMLASYVVVEGLVAEANRLHQAGQGQPVEHLRVLRSFLPMLRHFAGELGFSPAGRAGLRDAAEAGLDDADTARWRKFDELFEPCNARNIQALMATRIIGPADEELEEVTDADATATVQADPRPVEDGGAPGVVEDTCGISPTAERDGEGLRQGLAGAEGEVAPGES
jgi:hypothetical protein